MRIVTIMVLFVPIGSIAQKAKLKLAQKSFNAFDYVTAAEICSDILVSEKHRKDTTALRMIADCHLKMGNYFKSEAYLKELIAVPGKHTRDMMNLASVLKIQKKYGEALDVYRQLSNDPVVGKIAANYIDDENFATQILRDSSIYTVTNSKVNSDVSDFGPAFFDGKFAVFSSSRGQGKGGKRSYNWNQQPYLNIYTAPIASDSSLGEPKLLEGPLNTRFHEGTMAYDPVARKMYFTRNNYVKGKVKKSKTGMLNLVIVSSHYTTTGEWEAAEELSINSSEYSVGHPCMSNLGKRMWFVSDMPGGLGGTDIFYCEEVDGKWGTIKNAGPNINTAGDEMFPFLVRDSILYFSSDGLVGLGGLDLFYVDITNPGTKAKNLGYPINTSYDDFGPAIYSNERFGYFSSDRPGGKGDDDIYEFEVHPPDTVIITGVLTDELTLKPIESGLITVSNEDGSVSTTLTNKNGEYTLRAPWRDRLKIEASKKDYVPGSVELRADPRSAYLENADITLKKLDYAASGKVLFAENNQPAPGSIVKLFDLSGALLDSTIVGKDGAYFFPLESGKSFIVEASRPEYITLSSEVNSKNPSSKISNYDFKLFKPEKGTIVRLDNIYYDYNKWDIRPDAAKELYKLVKILQDNPTMVIELGSHSDSRGSDSYNLNLSTKRADSAVKYIISQGIESNRLVAKGYGETKVLNRCANDVECSDEEHQYNRRTEFKILDF